MHELVDIGCNLAHESFDCDRGRVVADAIAVGVRQIMVTGTSVTASAKALELSPGDPVMLYNGGCLYSQLGEKERAIATLKQAIAAGYWNLGWMQHDPDLDPLRGEPEFVELMKGR